MRGKQVIASTEVHILSSFDHASVEVLILTDVQSNANELSQSAWVYKVPKGKIKAVTIYTANMFIRQKRINFAFRTASAFLESTIK